MKKGTDLFNSSPSMNQTAEIAEPGVSRAKINPKSWNWEKSHEIS